MTNEDAIRVIEKHLEHWKRLVKEKIASENEGFETVEAFEKAVEALNIQPCEDCISREKVTDILEYWWDEDIDYYKNACRSIRELPSVQPTTKYRDANIDIIDAMMGEE